MEKLVIPDTISLTLVGFFEIGNNARMTLNNNKYFEENTESTIVSLHQ